MAFNVLTFLIRKLVVKYEVKKTVKKKRKSNKALTLTQHTKTTIQNYQGSQIKN